jgi:hypothetical protein
MRIQIVVQKIKVLKSKFPCRICLIALLLVGCIESTSLKFPGSERLAVIEGHLSNENTENYVRLTYSIPNGSSPSEEAIHNALVIIKDDAGQTDTFREDVSDDIEAGYYLPTYFKCATGRNYDLRVVVGEQEFSAKSFMPAIPAIDSVSVQYVKNELDKFSGYQPFLHFQDPPSQPNYYLTKICHESLPKDEDFTSQGINCYFTSRVWNFAILSDEFLKDGETGVNINVGSTSSTYYIQDLENGNYEARLYSLTAEAYLYYKALIESFRNDGGAYSPTPVTAPTNIKGGALGFFNTSSVSVRSFEVK